MKTVTKDRILLSVENEVQARRKSLEVVEQKLFSRMKRLVCALMVLKMLQVTDTTRIVVASQVFPSSNMVSRPPVVGVFVLFRRRSSIEIVT